MGVAEIGVTGSARLAEARGRSREVDSLDAGAVQWLESRPQATNEGCPMTMTDLPPTAIHRGEKELPFVDIGDGATLQLLQVDLSNGVWIVRNHFPPDTTIQTHKHTGHVLAFTQKGSWFYQEYPDVVNTAGSYLYEPAGSVHTLHVPATNEEVTDVWFAIHGANLNLGADGNVELVIDAHAILPFYLAACAEQHGVTDPPVVVIGG